MRTSIQINQVSNLVQKKPALQFFPLLKYCHVLFAVLVLSLKIYSQQDPAYSQYMFDLLAINPAFSGSRNIAFGALTYRNQFAGFEGGPVTQKLTFNAPVQRKYMGLGLKAVHDKSGAIETSAISGVYSYHIGIGKGKLSFGLEGGMGNYSVDFTNLVRAHPDDQALPDSKQSVFLPDASFGIYYYNSRFYLGLASFHLLQQRLEFTGYERTNPAQVFHHQFLSAGYKFEMNEKMDIEPSLLAKHVKGAPVQADLNANIIWKEMIAIGASYRTGDGLSFLCRYVVKEMLVVGYSYDLRLTELSKYSGGSHEIMAGYQMKLLPPASKKVTDPRYYF